VARTHRLVTRAEHLMAFYAAGATVIPLLVITQFVQLRLWEDVAEVYADREPDPFTTRFDLLMLRGGLPILFILLAAVGEACALGGLLEHDARLLFVVQLALIVLGVDVTSTLVAAMSREVPMWFSKLVFVAIMIAGIALIYRAAIRLP